MSKTNTGGSKKFVPSPKVKKGRFHIEFKNPAQKMAWGMFDQHDILFLTGPAGCGKTHLAVAFAVSEILAGRKKHLILTRPSVEAGEKLGFLPGDFSEKVSPYMRPFFDSLTKLVGRSSTTNLLRAQIDEVTEIAPLAYLRGTTFENAVCILDEAQNCSLAQLKLFLTRLGDDSKLIVGGDSTQPDIPNSGLSEVVDKLSAVKGIGMIQFKEESIVRHPLVGEIVKLI